VRILINTGSSQKPVFDAPRLVHADGKPIRLLMSRIYPNAQRYGHDLGYPLPVYIDWNADGLPDLMLPNLSNRIFWYQNIGTRRRPKFGRLKQLICDGYPESQAALKAIAQTLVQTGSNPPHDPSQPSRIRRSDRRRTSRHDYRRREQDHDLVRVVSRRWR